MTEIDGIIAKALGRGLRQLTPKELAQRRAAAKSRKRRQRRMEGAERAARSSANRGYGSPTEQQARIFAINQRNLYNLKVKEGDDPLRQNSRARDVYQSTLEQRKSRKRVGKTGR